MNSLFLIRILAASGFAISLYFQLVYRGTITGNESLLPGKLCKKNTCSDVLLTKFAAVFSIPNFMLGMYYYGILFILTFLAVPYWMYYILLIISWFVVLLSIYLAYALIFKLKTNCVLCFTSHLINLGIAIIITGLA